MFRSRTNDSFPSNGEISRQSIIHKILFTDKKPKTPIERLAASIYGNPYIDCIVRAKILKNFQNIEELLNTEWQKIANNNQSMFVDNTRPYSVEKLKFLSNVEIQVKIIRFLQNTTINIGDTVQMFRKQPIIAKKPTLERYNFGQLETTSNSMANIVEFEYIVFDNRVRYRYFIGTNFSSYLYQNLLYFLNVENPEMYNNGDNIAPWQAKFALLLKQTDINDYVAKNAFYENSVLYNGINYDTSFVPKYDVKALMPQPMIEIKTTLTDIQLIKAYYDLNERTTREVPADIMPIFLVFPFKNGHLIQKNGKIVYLNMFNESRRSVRAIHSNLCNLEDIEYAIEATSKNISYDDAVFLALYAQTIQEQAIALLILRRMVGPVLSIGSHLIELNDETTIMSWTKVSCDRRIIVLPRLYKHKSSIPWLQLIRNISNSCASKLGCCLMCSAYTLPEIHYTLIMSSLNNDAERYVFYTLVLQSHNIPNIYEARKNLDPIFGNAPFEIENIIEANARPYHDKTIDDVLDDMVVPLLQPNDVANIVDKCMPVTCPEKYEFSNGKLRSLVNDEPIELSNEELANYITLLITNTQTRL